MTEPIIDADSVAYINGQKVEYIDLTHTYYVDGKQVPSVTQLIANVLESPYSQVEPQVLQIAANRGIALHKEIDLYERHGIKGSSMEFHHYLRLKYVNRLNIMDTEKLIVISHQGKVVACGRLDMILTASNIHGLGIGDIKRTTRIYADHLKLQLNLYRLGYMQSYHQEISFLSCFHLRKYVYQYMYIDIDELCAIKAIEQYEKLNKR